MIDSNDTNELFLLKEKITKSFSLLIAREFFIKALSFVGQLIVARILVPSDFGIFVIISFIVNFFILFSDIGLTWSIIRSEKQPKELELSSVLFIKIVFSSIIIAIIYFLAPFITIFYSEFQKSHVSMLQIFSITILFTSLRSIPIALLERKIKYNMIAIIDVVGILVYQISALTLAFAGFGVWSLISSVILKEIIEVIIAYLFQPIPLRINISIKSIQYMLSFGVFLQGNSILTFIHTSIIPVLVGVKYGPYQVGLLDWSSKIASIPMTITENFGRVAFSGFSKIQNDKKFLAIMIERSMGILSIITLLFTVLILGFAPQAIEILYTKKWVAGVPSLYWFAASTFLISVMSAIGSGLLALGRSKEIFYVTLLSGITKWFCAISLVSLFGYIGVAITSTITSAVLFVLYLFIANKASLSINTSKVLLPKLFVFCCTLLFIYALNIITSQHIHIFVGKVILSLAMYLLLMYIFSQEDLKRIIKLASLLRLFFSSKKHI